MFSLLSMKPAECLDDGSRAIQHNDGMSNGLMSRSRDEHNLASRVDVLSAIGSVHLFVVFIRLLHLQISC